MSVKVGQNILEAIEQIRKSGFISDIVVDDSGRYLGMVRLSSLIRAALEGQETVTEDLVLEIPAFKTIENYVSNLIKICGEYRVDKIAIVDENNVLKQEISLYDNLKEIADRIATKDNLALSLVVSHKYVEVSKDTTVAYTLKLINNLDAEIAVILDENRNFIGYATKEDLLYAKLYRRGQAPVSEVMKESTGFLINEYMKEALVELANRKEVYLVLVNFFGEPVGYVSIFDILRKIKVPVERPITITVSCDDKDVEEFLRMAIEFKLKSWAVYSRLDEIRVIAKGAEEKSYWEIRIEAISEGKVIAVGESKTKTKDLYQALGQALERFEDALMKYSEISKKLPKKWGKPMLPETE